jgi:hypothetical protein
MELSKIDLVRQALWELGEASAQELVAFIQHRHGVRIEARFIPVLRASLLGQQMLERARQTARATTQAAAKPGGDGNTESVAETIPPSALQSAL